MYSYITHIRFWTILLLILSVAVFSLAQDHSCKVIKKNQTEQASKTNPKNTSQQVTVLSAELEAVIPFFAFDLLKDLYLILKLDFHYDFAEDIFTCESLYNSKYFKTLFCFVISPNAP